MAHPLPASWWQVLGPPSLVIGLASVAVLVGRLGGPLEGLDAGVRLAAGPSTPVQSEFVTCSAEPRSFEEIRALERRAEASPAAARTPGPVPTGRPVDVATIAVVRAAVEELLACFATGEPLRVWGLYSDAYLARLLYRQRGFDRAVYDAYATPRPAGADERVELRSLDGVVLLADGRIGATVFLFYPGIGLEKRFFFVFAEAGGRWLIDDIVGEITFAVP